MESNPKFAIDLDDFESRLAQAIENERPAPLSIPSQISTIQRWEFRRQQSNSLRRFAGVSKWIKSSLQRNRPDEHWIRSKRGET